MADSSSKLRDYFKRLSENIMNNELSNESALSATVEFPLSGWGKGKPLLQALGYEKGGVRQQYPIRVGTSKPRVDFMIGKEPNCWMLDLKKPGDICDRARHVEQLQSYMNQEKVAIGVLFNGSWALAYVNPEHSCLAGICSKITEEEINIIPDLDLRKSPVRKANMDSGDIKEMVNFFRLFKCDETLPEVKTLVPELTEQHIRKFRQEAKIAIRNKDIKSALLEVLSNPNEQILEAIIKASDSLSGLKAKPIELSNCWPHNFLSGDSFATKNKLMGRR